VGLKNLGNTCFMNSVLQSLHNIQPFTYYFSNLPKIDQPKARLVTRSIKENLEEVSLVEELRKVLIDLNSGIDNNKTSISPECLFLVIWKVVPQFKGYHQHDAHEFLRYMLDRLHTELQAVPNSMPPTPTNSKMKNFVCPAPANKGVSFVTTTFGGTLLSEVKCLVCGTNSRKHDPFLDLSLDIPEKYYKDLSDDGDDKEPLVCNIADCLSSFVAVEELTETELYYCSNCKKKQRSTKRFWIRRLPNVLCLHIKRFRWNSYYR
jgi:ubiquitin carboxyl-terminal hydrolase 3